MFDIDLPYDRGRMHLSLPDESVVGVLAGRQGDFTPDAGQEELVEREMCIRDSTLSAHSSPMNMSMISALLTQRPWAKSYI